MRRLGTWLVLTAGAVGCIGPISDWPSKGHDDSDPFTGGMGATAGDAGVSSPVTGSQGGSSVSTGSAGGTTSGTVGGSIAGAAPGATPGTGATGGGTSSDAGNVTVPPRDGGATAGPPGADAGAAPDASLIDAGTIDAGPIDAGASDAGDAGAIDAGRDGGSSCVVGFDAGVRGCAAYGCGTTLETLRAASRDGGVCATPEALPYACDGTLTQVAVRCTQDNALGLGLGRPVTNCLRRAPQFSRVSGECLQCYADEVLCTLSRCLAACIDERDPACQQCRQHNCADAFARCSGLPAF